MAGGVSSSIQDSRRRVLVRRRKRILLKNEAQLNCVSLRSRFDGVARRGLSRVEMNALAGALDSPLRAEGRVFFISCLTTPTLLYMDIDAGFLRCSGNGTLGQDIFRALKSCFDNNANCNALGEVFLVIHL